MRGNLRAIALAGVLTIGGALGLVADSAHAQGGNRRFVQRGAPGVAARPGSRLGPVYNPAQPYTFRQQLGFRQGLIYQETGRRPSRPMTPAQQQGFKAGRQFSATRGEHRPR